MTKKFKSILTITAVVVLACAMAAMAFAATATKFGAFNTNGYTGTYNAELTVTNKRTDASLNVTIKKNPGFLPNDGAVIIGDVISNGDSVGQLYDTGLTACDTYCTYSSEHGYSDVTATCTYYYYYNTLCTLKETAE